MKILAFTITPARPRFSLVITKEGARNHLSLFTQKADPVALFRATQSGGGQ